MYNLHLVWLEYVIMWLKCDTVGEMKNSNSIWRDRMKEGKMKRRGPKFWFKLELLISQFL
jgi:hypothetical protein